jgi:streptomycin 6-kinase
MTDQFAVPETVLANVRRRWPTVAGKWASLVDAEFRSLCERYQATPQSVLSARYGLVVAVDTSNGPLVFRSSPDPRGKAQAAVAVALAELGAAPRVHEADTTDHGTWTVCRRVPHLVKLILRLSTLKRSSRR